MKDLCDRIGMPEEVTEDILRIHEDPGFLPDISGLRQEERWQDALQTLKEELGEDPKELKQLCCMLRCVLEAKNEYAALGLTDTIYYDTFACFSRFVREHKESYGNYGFDRGFWTVRQVSGKLFRIGQMEYELTALEGKKAISLHIPSDAHLNGFRESWKLAKPLLGRVFTDYAEAPVFCRSWLLAPELKQLLPGNSQILAFQKNFHIRSLNVSTGGYKLWVFKDPRLPPEAYPEDTTLQRNLKAWVLNGGTLTDALGILKE